MEPEARGMHAPSTDFRLEPAVGTSSRLVLWHVQVQIGISWRQVFRFLRSQFLQLWIRIFLRREAEREASVVPRCTKMARVRNDPALYERFHDALCIIQISARVPQFL